MPTITITQCPICGNNDLQQALKITDYFASGEDFPLCDCKVCGFRFTNHFPAEETIGKYYDSPDYISHSDTDKGMTNRLYHFFRTQMLKRKVDLVAVHTSPRPIRLLDIGCGTGYFLQAAAKQGWAISGIEKDKKAREKAILRSGAEIKDHHSLWETTPESYNAITLWHVLEHLEKLNETMHQIREIITPDGTVVIALPNCHSFDAQFYKEYWAAYDIPRHLWHFSPSSVEALFRKHGFTITQQYTMPLDAFYISLLSEKYRKSNRLIQYSRAIAVGTGGFIRSLSDKSQSSSIIYIAKKREIR